MKKIDELEILEEISEIDSSKKERKKRINSKQKGNRAELECAKIFNKRFPDYTFKRVPQSGAIFGQSNKENTEKIDEEIKITLSGDIICPLNFKFSIEHKAYNEADFWGLFNESSDLHNWMKQCKADAVFVGKEPMLIVKYNNKKRIVFTRFKFDNYIFEHQGWYCYWLEDYFKNPDNHFFNQR